MVLIFYYSSRTGVESTGNSSGITQRIFGFFYPDVSGWDNQAIADTLGTIEVFVRKTAHVLEFAVLGGLVYFSIMPMVSSWKRVWIAFVISLVYAISDEIHQLFVPGRSGQVTDVIIDSVGIIIGVLVAKVFSDILKKKGTKSRRKR